MTRTSVTYKVGGWRASYSLRSAMTGSTRAARIAGAALAHAAAARSAAGTARKTSGSRALVEKSIEDTTRASASDAIEPSATPTAVRRRPLNKVSLRISSGLRAERHAEAQLARPLRHGEGDHAVDAGHREQQRDAGEDPQQHRSEPGRRHRPVKGRVHRRHADRDVAVQRPHRLDDRLREPQRIGRRCASPASVPSSRAGAAGTA